MTHTPGPWNVDPVIRGSKVWAGEMMVCDIRGWGHLTGRGALALPDEMAIQIQEANANLIAAAPDLLAALTALRACTIVAKHPEDRGPFFQAHKMADKAIAKAKGEE